MKRRQFIKNTSLTTAGLAVGKTLLSCQESTSNQDQSETKNEATTASLPLVIATWNVQNATAKAWETLQNGNSVLDAIEIGCNVEEDNAEG